MTTLGVQPPRRDRIMPMNMPSYAYHYPSLQTLKLAAVKEGLFHPRLPSIRRMDMDTAAHKLPDEHCRTTTSCGPRDFRHATSSVSCNPDKRLASAGITDTGRNLRQYYTSPDELKQTRMEWSDFLNRCPERFNIRLGDLPENNMKPDLHFTGYAVRYLRPEITSSWRYTMGQEPNLDQFGQRPIPANIYGRYRDTYPQYSRNISSEAWR